MSWKSVKMIIVGNYFFVGGLSVNCIREKVSYSFPESSLSLLYRVRDLIAAAPGGPNVSLKPRRPHPVHYLEVVG